MGQVSVAADDDRSTAEEKLPNAAVSLILFSHFLSRI